MNLTNALTLAETQPIEEMLGEIASWQAETLHLAVASEADAAALADARNRVRDMAKKIEDYRKERKAPALAEGKAIDARYKPAVDALEAIRQRMDAIGREWIARCLQSRGMDEEARTAILRELTYILSKGDSVSPAEKHRMETLELALATTPSDDSFGLKGLSIRWIWKARVDDESKVPDLYKSIDLPAINKVARETKGKGWIPGVEFYQEMQLAREAE